VLWWTLKRLNSSSASVRARVARRLARRLGQLNEPRAVDGLVRALADPDAEVRQSAAWALEDTYHSPTMIRRE
jgi:HEAT repeat protein